MTIPLYPGAPSLFVTAGECPVSFKRRNKRTVLFNNVGFNERTYRFQDIDKVNRLPEKNGLYGVSLAPRFDHYHNFIVFEGDNPLPPSKYIDGAQVDGRLLDDRGIVSKEINLGRTGLLEWFSWLASIARNR